MTLAIDVSKAENHVTMTVSGEVDTKTAPELLQELTKLDLNSLGQLRLKLAEVGFMSSAGLRALVFAKQKMPHSSSLYVIGASEVIQETITKTGLAQAVVMVSNEDDIK